MFRAAFGLELRRSRSLALWLIVVVVAYGAFIAALYPVIRDNTKFLDEYLKVMPREFLAAFGMTGNLADHGVFFNTYVASYVWPMVAAIAGIILATRPAADLDRGFLELPLGTPISRLRYLLASISCELLVLAVLSLALVAGVLAVGPFVSAGFDLVRFLAVAPPAFAFGAAIAAGTTLLTVATLSRGRAAGIAAGILIAMYLVHVAAQIQPSLAGVADFSLFRYFATAPIIDRGVLPVGDTGLLAVVAVICWVAAAAVFRRRDLVA